MDSSNNLNLPRMLTNIKSPTKSPIKYMYHKEPLKIIIPDFDYQVNNNNNNFHPPLAPRQKKTFNFSFVEESN